MELSSWIIDSWALVVVVADLYAVTRVAQSNVEPARKAVWIALILALPVLGLLLWWAVGPRWAQ